MINYIKDINPKLILNNNYHLIKNMKSNENGAKSRLKSYHLFLLSCLLCCIFILNSNYVNKKRDEDKMNKEQDAFFNDIIRKRNLGEKEEPLGTEENKNSNEVCSRGSDELKSYYRTGDLSDIDLDDKDIECEDKDKDYIKALISLVEKMVNNSTELNVDELDEEDKENIKTYSMHIIVWFVFLIFGFLSIIGWLICCFCNCCNCCCCCCCKKPGCKAPCFVFTYIFYALVVIACIYGWSKTNKIFTGLADTECSILRLLEQVIDGEVKGEPPRWIGISGINDLLDGFKEQINVAKNYALSEFKNEKDYITSNKSSFTTEMDNFEKYCYNSGNYPEEYTKTFDDVSSGHYKNKKYVLDIIKFIGHKDENDKYPEKSFLNILNTEYSNVAEKTDGFVEKSEGSFNDILKNSTDDVLDALDQAKETLDEFKKPFDKINNKIGEKISQYSKDIEDYGKLVVKLVFVVLILINVALAALLLLICLCSLKACTDCCCCRCLCKCFTHLFWNILALMMIVSFIVGSILALVGRIGADSMSLVSYIVGGENFEKESPLLLDKLGDAQKYLNICLHGNGTLEEEFDLGDSLKYIEDIDEVLNGLDNVTQTFQNIIKDLPSFAILEGLIKNRTNYQTSEFGITNIQNETDFIALKVFLELLNKDASNEGDTWDIDGDKSKICSTGNDNLPATGNKLHPSSCKPIYRDWIEKTSNQAIKDYAIIISSIVDLVGQLKDESANSFQKKLTKLNDTYHNYLGSYIGMTSFLKKTINNLIGGLKEKVGDGKIFSFLNGKFIGINIKIILKYLKNSLGGDIYNVGLCLIIVGFSLILSISSTILLIVIINTELEKNKNDEKYHHRAYEKNFNNSEERKFRK